MVLSSHCSTWPSLPFHWWWPFPPTRLIVNDARCLGKMSSVSPSFPTPLFSFLVRVISNSHSSLPFCESFQQSFFSFLVRFIPSVKLSVTSVCHFLSTPMYLTSVPSSFAKFGILNHPAYRIAFILSTHNLNAEQTRCDRSWWFSGFWASQYPSQVSGLQGKVLMCIWRERTLVLS